MSSEWSTLIDGYLVTLAAAGRSPATNALRSDQLHNFARAMGRTPADVTGDDLLSWFAMMPWQAETRRSYRAAIRGFFTWAYRQGHTSTDLGQVLPVMRQHISPPRPTPDTAYQTALAKADERTALMLRLAAEAGLRRGEIAAIHSSDLIHALGGYLLMVHGKGDKRRLVPVTDELAEAICTRQGWVFPNRTGGHLSPTYVGILCSRVLPDVWTLHTLRHRFASRAYRGSRNLRAVQALLGHSSLSVTERYLEVDESEMRAAMLAAVA